MVSGIFIVFYLGPTKIDLPKKKKKTKKKKKRKKLLIVNLLFIDFVLHYVFR